MNRSVLRIGLMILGAAAALAPARAWAPPLCSGHRIEQEVLSLQVRSVTVDGAPLSVPANSYRLQSGCALDALDGVLMDPDDPSQFRATFWGREAP
jgi:hypothetical protein